MGWRKTRKVREAVRGKSGYVVVLKKVRKQGL
jgi:hypothetical protein